MYAACIHCNKPLGTNESIEAFPVGRRLAFDASNGRLWAVCRHCERWNLSPIDERWEAIEQASRAFRDTHVRASTDNIGLARLRDGTDLVRIGKPLRPEFAAWRYGDQFGRRRLRSAFYVGGAATAAGLGAFGMATAGAGVLAFLPLVQVLNVALLASTTVMHSPIAHPEGGWFMPVGNPKLVELPETTEGWGIEIGYSFRGPEEQAPSMRAMFKESLRRFQNTSNEVGRTVLHGHAAAPLLRRVLPRVNRGGASRGTLRESVALIERAGSGEAFGRWAAAQRREWGARQAMGDTGDLKFIPAPARLAFEMALHEDTERRALDGELATLEQAWRDADEIAKIADGLLPSEDLDRRLTQLRGETRE